MVYVPLSDRLDKAIEVDRANQKPHTVTGLNDVVDVGEVNAPNSAAFVAVIPIDDSIALSSADGSDTGVVIPRNSIIVDVKWVGVNGAGTVDIGTSSDIDFLVDGMSISTDLTFVTAATAVEANWADVGDDNIRVYAGVSSAQASNTAGNIFITYIRPV